MARAGLLATGALAAMLVAACNPGQPTGAGSPTVPTFSSSSSQVTSSTPETSSATESSSPPATSSKANSGGSGGSGAGSSPTDCKAADLKLSLSQGDAGAGHAFRALRFTNSGGRTCTMQGFPGVSYVAGDDGHQVGPAAYRDGHKGAVVTLHPGDTAYAEVSFTNVHNYDPADCRPTATRGLRIYPPHDTAAMFIATPGTGCAHTPPGNQLSVQTVRPGSGA